MSTPFTRSLDQLLNIPELNTTTDVVPVNQHVDDDVEYARQNLRSIIDKGTDALDTVILLAKTSESPRAFEVASQMLKTLSDSNKDLLELQKRAKDLRKDDVNRGPSTVNNNLFVGSTAELQKFIKSRKNQDVS